MKTFRLIKTLGMALLTICMCVNFTACSDDEEGYSIVAGKTFHTSWEFGGGDGDNEHREYTNETLFFGANGVVSYRLQCREVWWGPDSGDGENSWIRNREGTYTINGDRIIISGISSLSKSINCPYLIPLIIPVDSVSNLPYLSIKLLTSSLYKAL